jgi:hypothetical protein
MSKGAATLSRAAPHDVGLDYVALLTEGTALVQVLSGEEWTNYNFSDPGVTILEQLCYALTELSYRADMTVGELLGAPETGLVALPRQGLYPAEAIMPVNPVTLDDLRRLVIDRVAEVGNAWFMPLEPGETDGVSGLYRLALLVPALDPGCDDEGPDPAAVRRDALDCYTAHRALCEDVQSAVVLRPLRIRVRAEVQLDDPSDPDTVLADLQFRLGLTLAPEPKRSSLDEQLKQGRTTAEIFNGPLMTRGFIDEDELGRLPSRVRVDDLLEVMAATPGVLSVDARRLSVHVAGIDRNFVPGDEIEVPQGCILWLETGRRADDEAIRLMHGTAVCRPHPARVDRLLARAWSKQRATYDLAAQYAKHYPPPAGNGADLAAYSSVQNQFPNVYGIGAYGLPPDAGPARQAQAKQLKGYLMVFDQLMADFFAQLAFVRDLFSIEAGGDKTYATQSLRLIVPNAKPLLGAGYEAGLREIVASSDPVEKRRNAVLDLLLSLYAEAIALPVDSACGEGGAAASGKALIEAKQALLARMVPATRDRGRGIDYRRGALASALPALEIRCRIELALLDAIARHGSAGVDPDGEDFGHPLPKALGERIARTFLRVEGKEGEIGERDDELSPLEGKSVAPALLSALADPARYRLGALPGHGPVYLVCEDFDGVWWALGEFPDAARAVAMTDRLVRAARPGRQRLYIVEWTLLRYALEDRRDDPATTDAEDEYSFRITAVLPARGRADEGEAGQGEEGARRRQACAIIRANMPAHVVVETLFLRPRAMRHFRRLYASWREALHRGRPERRARTSRRLERFLKDSRPPVPPAPPPPPTPPPPLPGRVEAATAGAFGFATGTALTARSAEAFAAAGFDFTIRYLTGDAPETEPDLTRSEALDIIDAGLALMAVQQPPPAGWSPSAELGTERGCWAAANAELVGLPAGLSLWLDLAGMATDAPDEAQVAYCNAWCAPVAATGYVPGLRVGAEGLPAGAGGPVPLRFERYWQSGGTAPDPAGRGYCLVEIGAGEGERVQADDLGGLPFWLTAIADPILAFTVAADPVVAGSPITFTLSWDVAGGANFAILADDGPGGTIYPIPLPLPASGRGSCTVTPKRLEVHYTLQILPT